MSERSSEMLNTEVWIPNIITKEELEKALERRFPGSCVHVRTVHVATEPPFLNKKDHPDDVVYWIHTPIQYTGEEVHAFLAEFANAHGFDYNKHPRDPR